ncbi:hypothetical protein IJ531_07185 [bacterium]|nr:hypothetical protein [bacterium]
MIDKICYKQGFNNSYAPSSEKTTPEKFIERNKKSEEFLYQGNISYKKLWSMTAALASGFAYLGWETALLLKVNSLRKTLSGIELEEYKKKQGKYFIIFAIAALAAIGVIQRILDKFYDKNKNILSEQFSEINKDTNAKLAPEPSSGYLGASYSAASGYITSNKMIVNDPLMKSKSKTILEKQVEAARKFETIARSKNGIEKVNYLALKPYLDYVKQDPAAAQELIGLYFEMQNDKTKKYDNMFFDFESRKTNFKSYISALYHAYLNKENDYSNIPIFIDEAHYKEVIAKKGSLSEKDEALANKYYDEMLNYRPLSAHDVLLRSKNSLK